ncbi:hypothetical protein [Salarchaeum japonicum]|uniref:Uncharacterized protein n=1 Tax=Salarchaeum japonicum TaxID=555573 RepID=A0AAV3T1K9_9EURY|nr:hypothetical protein [Salarchaeum japonicum]
MSERVDTVTVLVLGDPQDSVSQYAATTDHDVRVGDSPADIDDDTHVVVVDATSDIPIRAVLDRVRDRGYTCGLLILNDGDRLTRGIDLALPAPASPEEVADGVGRVFRRVAYEAVVDDLFALCERRADLLDDGDEDELDEVSERIRERRECTDDIAATFDDDDYRAAFRDLD